jgi:hypothetical protein
VLKSSWAGHHRKTFADQDSAPLAALLASRFARAARSSMEEIGERATSTQLIAGDSELPTCEGFCADWKFRQRE